MNCLECQRDLARPDASHRYCPFCGTTRVLHEAGADVDKVGLLVGFESISPLSGARYATDRLAAPPTKLDALRGPHRTAAGAPWPDLFASSGTLHTETALHRYAQPPPASTGRAEKALNVRIWRITHRHRRLYILTEGGQLWALDDGTLDHAPLWDHARVEGATPATKLLVTDTLVLTVTQGPNDCRIQGFDAGQCRRLIDVRVPLTRTAVAVSGGHLLIVGVTVTGAPTAQRYPLDAFETSSSPPPQRWTPSSPHGGRSPDVDACAFGLGGGHVFLLPDGKAYRWHADSDACEVVWPNPTQEVWMMHQPLLSWTSGAISVMTRTSDDFWLRTYKPAADGRIDVDDAASHPVAPLRDSCSRFAAACIDRLYVLSHPSNQPLSVLHSHAHDPTDLQLLMVLAGSANKTVTHFQTVAWNGVPKLLLRLHPTDRQTQEFWIIDPASGAHDSVFGARARSENLEVVWGAGRCWLANMDKGRIECAG